MTMTLRFCFDSVLLLFKNMCISVLETYCSRNTWVHTIELCPLLTAVWWRLFWGRSIGKEAYIQAQLFAGFGFHTCMVMATRRGGFECVVGKVWNGSWCLVRNITCEEESWEKNFTMSFWENIFIYRLIATRTKGYWNGAIDYQNVSNDSETVNVLTTGSSMVR